MKYVWHFILSVNDKNNTKVGSTRPWQHIVAKTFCAHWLRSGMSAYGGRNQTLCRDIRTEVGVNLRLCGVQSPSDPSGPPHCEGKRQTRRGGALGKLFCIFPLLFLIHSFSPTHSFSFLQPSLFPSFIFLLSCLFARIASCAVCPSLYGCCPPPP